MPESYPSEPTIASRTEPKMAFHEDAKPGDLGQFGTRAGGSGDFSRGTRTVVRPSHGLTKTGRTPEGQGGRRKTHLRLLTLVHELKTHYSGNKSATNSGSPRRAYKALQLKIVAGPGFSKLAKGLEPPTC